MKAIAQNEARDCPHCHKRNLFYVAGAAQRVNLRWCVVACADCGAQGPTAIGRHHNGEHRDILHASALKKFNKR